MVVDIAASFSHVNAVLKVLESMANWKGLVKRSSRTGIFMRYSITQYMCVWCMCVWCVRVRVHVCVCACACACACACVHV